MNPNDPPPKFVQVLATIGATIVMLTVMAIVTVLCIAVVVDLAKLLIR